MKKSLLFFAACALSLNAAFAGEITEDFAVAPKTASTETVSATSDNGVDYTFTNVARNNNNALLMTLDGSSFTASLKESCSKIVLNGADNTATGSGAKIKLAVGENQISTVTVDATAKNFVFEIPEAYQAAGTVYKFERVGGNNRIASVTYTTVDTKVEAWATPEFSIPDASYVLAGQKISVTNLEDGASVTYSYTVGKNETNAEGPEFTIPAFTGTLIAATLTATVSGEGKESSSATLNLNLSNGKRPVISDFYYVGCEATPEGTATFYYNLGVINLYGNTAVTKVTISILDSEGNVVATAVDDTINVKPADSAEAQAASEIEPLVPTEMSRTAVATGLAKGTYTIAISHQVGNNAAVDVDLTGRYIEFKVEDKIFTGVEEVEAADNQATEYYNLQGVRVANPQPGQILIMVKGGSVVKTVIR